MQKFKRFVKDLWWQLGQMADASIGVIAEIDWLKMFVFLVTFGVLGTWLGMLIVRDWPASSPGFLIFIWVGIISSVVVELTCNRRDW